MTFGGKTYVTEMKGFVVDDDEAALFVDVVVVERKLRILSSVTASTCWGIKHSLAFDSFVGRRNSFDTAG